MDVDVACPVCKSFEIEKCPFNVKMEDDRNVILLKCYKMWLPGKLSSSSPNGKATN